MSFETKAVIGLFGSTICGIILGYYLGVRDVPTPVASSGINTDVIKIPVVSNMVNGTSGTFKTHASYDERQIYIYQQAIERALKNVTIKTEDVNKWQGGYIHTNGPSFRPNIINVTPDYLHVTP